jgi:tetratricopeptide (TPR) repeat protein
MLGHMAMIAPPTPTGWGNNTAAAVLAVPTDLLRARIAWAEDKKDEAIEHLKLAVTHEDAMVYDEPPQWFAPARESLGGAYLKTAQYGKAVETFHAALEQHPKSGRALYGLLLACENVTKPNPKCPADVARQFKTAWEHADYPINVDRLW